MMRAWLKRARARRALPLLLACLVAPAIPGCRRPAPATGPVPVTVEVLAPRPITVSRRYSGSVEPRQTTSLAFKLPGTVASLYRPPGMNRDVEVGDTLAKGTVIAELDEGDLRRAVMGAQARVAQLEARLATAEETLAIAVRNLERFDSSAGSVSKLARDEADARKVAAAGELESAQHALADARIQLDQARDDYDNRRLIVPFDRATVSEKNIEPGERKAAHEVAFRLIDISTVHVNFGVPDTVLGSPVPAGAAADRVELGRDLVLTADAFDGRPLTGTVTRIAPEADPATRTFLVQLTLPNQSRPDGQPLLRPGMIVSVLVGGELDRRALLLPMTAVHQPAGDPGGALDNLFVYEAVAEGGKDVARARRVRVGGVYDSRVEVLPDSSQVRAGARIVLSTSERLTDGAAVSVLPSPTDPAATLPEAR